MRLISIPLMLILITCVFLLVYYTGGIKYVYSHSMYIPIVIGALIFGVRGGVIFGIIGGITLGPFMPIDVSTGEMQKTINWVYRTGFFVAIGFITGVASDVVQIYVRKMQWNLRHDDSTGLPNRYALTEELETLVSDNKPPDVSVLIISSVNNTRQLKTAFGIEVIDATIHKISERYRIESERLDHKFHIYRADSGSICTVIGSHPTKTLKELLRHLTRIAKQPFTFQGIPIHIDFRMGIVPFETLDGPAHSYLQNAETAMNQAHENLKDFLCYGEELESNVKENMSILGELNDALELNQLAMHYQPKVDVKTGQVVSVEALMRWTHPMKGNIPPGIFIPAAEHSTLIFDITKFALESALQQITRWNQQGINLPIAVNVSPLNLSEPGFAEIIADLLQDYDVSGHQLELEVTETALMMDVKTATRELTKIAEQGVTISVDDFGTGYSSLQYLEKLPISIIKIDQSFIRQIANDKSSSHIVEATISLAHRLKLGVIAEGVEDRVTYDYLMDKGCDYIQGYFISKPLAEAEFKEWLLRYEVESFI